MFLAIWFPISRRFVRARLTHPDIARVHSRIDATVHELADHLMNHHATVLIDVPVSPLPAFDVTT
ncbi:hypothetical protein GGQ68_001395 [Sagittula marina]|uniref:Uncharacterized protein n=1 Tax=Sagittula marina TaxID=943940 RepID=A0A7W6GR60_9RHOB|nr:hypothetical protein [Sagittula marina]MBB3985066.1 hypothetical protein [Sagittula marina]